MKFTKKNWKMFENFMKIVILAEIDEIFSAENSRNFKAIKFSFNV